MNPISPDNCLVQFAKAPVSGRVKTRLQPELGQKGCFELHCLLVEHVLLQFVNEKHLCQQLWCSEPHPFFQALTDGFPVSLYFQQGSDLGERMAAAFHASLQRFGKVVLIGSDCPALSPKHLNTALNMLDEVPAVFGPATDGGYVLVGLTRNEPALFRDIPWGSPEVMRATRARLTEIGWDWRELEILPDIDRADDLHHLSGYKKLAFFAKNY